MNSTEIKRGNLLDILRENRAKHIIAFNLALEHRRQDILDKIPLLLEQFKRKELDIEQINFPLPVSSEKDYDTVIRKMELDIRDTIEIDDRQFQNWVMDEWIWTNDFIRTSSTYAMGKM